MIHIIAHRGASAYEPENTLRAFERAIEMGATMLELDIQLSRDGYPMVIHDADLATTTNGCGRVEQTDLSEIKKLDAGRGEQVPTLPEVIDLARGRAELYIELKGQRTPAPVMEVLRSEAAIDQVILNSFFPWLIQKTKFIDRSVRTSMLVRRQDRERDYVSWALAVEADFVHPCWENASPTPHQLLTPAVIQGCRRHNLGIITWHEEHPSELRKLVELDVDGICTNTPDLLQQILNDSKGA